MKPTPRLRDAIDFIKKQNGLTNEEVSKALGYKTKSYVSDILGGNKTITRLFLDRLKAYYQIDPDYILGESAAMVKDSIESKKSTFQYVENREESKGVEVNERLPSGGVVVTLRDYLAEMKENKVFLQDMIRKYLSGMKTNLDYVAGKSEALEYDLKSGREAVLKALSLVLGHPDENFLLDKADKRRSDLARAKNESYKNQKAHKKGKAVAR